MLTNSQKEHLTYTAIGQGAVLIGLIIWTTSYVLPWLDKIWQNIETANASVTAYNEVEKNGISYESLKTLISGRPEYTELWKIMSTDVEWTTETIKKVWNDKYLDWLKKSIWSSAEDKNILLQEKKKLNSILPTLSPISWNIEEENITLKVYIKYIETQIIKKFNLDTELALWISTITPWMGTDGIPKNIWSISLQISFRAKNKDILAFINYLNNTGNPSILIDTGTTLSIQDIPGIMSNPLITIDDFWLDKPLDKKNGDEENWWRITLLFYVRWISKDDILYLSESVRTREESLGIAIEKAVADCKTQASFCISIQEPLNIIQKKFMEYKRSMGVLDSKNIGWWVDKITELSQRMSVLKALEAEFNEITAKNTTDN